MKVIILLIFLSISPVVFPHSGEKHEPPDKGTSKTIPKIEVDAQKEINEAYVKSVRPIFKRSCFDCHSNQTKYPWYYKLPIVKGIIDEDIKEAKKHLDFSNDFPFISHDVPRKDLEAIEKSIRDGRMPPANYRLLHWDAKLSEEDKKTVINWIQESLKILSLESIEHNSQHDSL